MPVMHNSAPVRRAQESDPFTRRDRLAAAMMVAAEAVPPGIQVGHGDGGLIGAETELDGLEAEIERRVREYEFDEDRLGPMFETAVLLDRRTR